MNSSLSHQDISKETLDLLEKEQQEFNNHWVWKELNCTPDDFFKALNRHVQTLNVPPQEWKQAYDHAKESSRVRSAERRASYKPASLRIIGALRV